MKFILLVAAFAAGNPQPNVVTTEVPSLEKCIELATKLVRDNQPKVGTNMPGFAAGCMVKQK